MFFNFYKKLQNKLFVCKQKFFSFYNLSRMLEFTRNRQEKKLETKI